MKEKCAEIEMFQKKYDSFNVHQKVRELIGSFRTKLVRKLVDEDELPKYLERIKCPVPKWKTDFILFYVKIVQHVVESLNLLCWSWYDVCAEKPRSFNANACVGQIFHK